MALLSLYLLSVAGGVIWIFNVEAAAILYSGKLGYHPLIVGPICALGQSTAYALLFIFGDALHARWAWARRQTDRMLSRWGDRLDSRFLVFTAAAAMFGVPPMTGMALIAPGFRVRLLPLLAVALSLRTIRLILLAAFGAQLVAWWHRVF